MALLSLYIIINLFYHALKMFYFVFVWYQIPALAINVGSVQHNDGFLPGIILLTQCYYHRGTRLNAMKRFKCHKSLIFSSDRGMLRS